MNERLEETIRLLLRKAELNILTFDRHRRTTMGFNGRRLPFYVMSYHKEGTAKLRIHPDRVYRIPPKTVILIPPHVLHDHYKDSGEETEFMFWHFTFMIDHVLDVLQLFRIPLLFSLTRYRTFEETFARYLEELNGQPQGLLSPVLEKAKSYELFHLLLQEMLESEGGIVFKPNSHCFLDMLARIVQQPEQPLSLEALASEYHMNATYISNRFKELFGVSPIQLQREIRIRKAKSLLDTTDLSIIQVGQMVGCPELPHFSRLFKAVTGLSPSEYRKRPALQGSPL